MKEFNNGWWNCFLAYTDELSSCNQDYADYAHTMLHGAGITKQEINYILEQGSMFDKTRSLLVEYRNNLQKSKKDEF